MTQPKPKNRSSRPANERKGTAKAKSTFAPGEDPRDNSGPQNWRERFAVKRMVGRPSVYDKTFHPQSYIDLCRIGKTKAQICGMWGIHRGTLMEWTKDQSRPEFSTAIKEGDELRIAWWEEFGAQGILAKRFQQVGWIYFMNNVCQRDYRARVEHTHALNIEDMDFGE